MAVVARAVESASTPRPSSLRRYPFGTAGEPVPNEGDLFVQLDPRPTMYLFLDIGSGTRWIPVADQHPPQFFSSNPGDEPSTDPQLPATADLIPGSIYHDAPGTGRTWVWAWNHTTMSWVWRQANPFGMPDTDPAQAGFAARAARQHHRPGDVARRRRSAGPVYRQPRRHARHRPGDGQGVMGTCPARRWPRYPGVPARAQSQRSPRHGSACRRHWHPGVGGRPVALRRACRSDGLFGGRFRGPFDQNQGYAAGDVVYSSGPSATSEPPRRTRPVTSVPVRRTTG